MSCRSNYEVKGLLQIAKWSFSLRIAEKSRSKVDCANMKWVTLTETLADPAGHPSSAT
jgi:hypothetical protein